MANGWFYSEYGDDMTK